MLKSPVPYQHEIASWDALRRVQLAWWEIRAICDMDVTYMQVMAEQANKEYARWNQERRQVRVPGRHVDASVNIGSGHWRSLLPYATIKASSP